MRKNPRGLFEKGGVWWIRYADAEGRERREKAGTKSVALKLYTKRKQGALEHRKLPENLRARKTTFAELASDALEYSKAHKLSYRDDKSRMKRLTDWIGQREACSISPQEIDRWLVSLGRTPATMNRYRALLSLTYKLGIREEKITGNPARLVRQRPEDNGRIRWLSPEEERKLQKVIMEKCPHHWPAVQLAIHTGIRRGEQFNLRWENVDIERRQLVIKRTKNGNPKYVPLNDAAIDALQAAQKLANGQPWVFLNRYGGRLTTGRDWFEPAVKCAGLAGLRWHDLRHTFCSRLVQNGVDLRTVQELMGHKGLAMTLRYAHLAPEHKLSAVQRLCGTLENGTGTTTGTDTEAAVRASVQMVN